MVVSQEQRSRTLEQLEGEVWGEPQFDSYVVTESHRLRRVPIRQLTVENLRLLVGQKLGLPWVLELALEILEVEPFAEGDLYEGDLLASVMELSRAELSACSELLERVRLVAESVARELRARSRGDPWGTHANTLRAIERLFLAHGSA